MLAGVNDRYEPPRRWRSRSCSPLDRATRAPRRPGLRTPGRAGRAGQGEGARDPRMFKVNLIPYNPTGGRRSAGASHSSGDGEGAVSRARGREAIAAASARRWKERGAWRATVRLTRGRDIDAAACGQLAASARRGIDGREMFDRCHDSACIERLFDFGGVACGRARRAERRWNRPSRPTGRRSGRPDGGHRKRLRRRDTQGRKRASGICPERPYSMESVRPPP